MSIRVPTDKDLRDFADSVLGVNPTDARASLIGLERKPGETDAELESRINIVRPIHMPKAPPTHPRLKPLRDHIETIRRDIGHKQRNGKNAQRDQVTLELLQAYENELTK